MVLDVCPWFLEERKILSKKKLQCPHCKGYFEVYSNPKPTVDIIIELEGSSTPSIVLIDRKNPPYGWAIPGGFVDYGESCEEAAVREAKEETGLDVELQGQIGTYSDPQRDPRHHTITVVFAAGASGVPTAMDDAKDIAVFPLASLPSPLCFDHDSVLEHYIKWRRGGQPEKLVFTL